MNLVCFPHYTCGGLVCDILNNTFSSVGNNGGINSIMHGVGKIGDTDTVFDEFDPVEFTNAISKLNVDKDHWIGTHCWPGRVDTTMFDQVIVITTTTFRSKVYRWVRAYHHYYTKSVPWTTVTGIARIDKERETAKNYLIPFNPVAQPNIINIEFAEIVETSTEFDKLIVDTVKDTHMNRWKSVNKFLYDNNFWNCDPVKRYYEAETEVNLQKHYVYE